jgi:hypothetical protein
MPEFNRFSSEEKLKEKRKAAVEAKNSRVTQAIIQRSFHLKKGGHT